MNLKYSNVLIADHVNKMSESK